MSVWIWLPQRCLHPEAIGLPDGNDQRPDVNTMKKGTIEKQAHVVEE
jgi:hypothetical protein